MKLSDVCEFIVDCPHSTAPDEGAGYPLIRTPNIGRGRLNLNGVHRVSEKIYLQRTQRGIPQKNDLILAREAPAGNVAIIKNEGKVCLGQRTVLIRPLPDKANPDYLTYYLLSPQQQYNLLGTANGATIAHVNLSTIRNLKIQLPPINIQCHIVDILSAYDELIEVNQKQIRLLEEAARRLYREWFVDLRLPGHEDTPITDGIPAGWSKEILQNTISYEIGGGWGEDYPTGKYSLPAYVFRGTDLFGLTHGELTSLPFRYHSENNLKSRKIISGDIIFEVSGGSRTEGVAKTALITQPLLDYFSSPIICASFCKLIRAKTPEFSFYLYATLRHLRDTGKTTEYDKRSASSIVNYRWKDFLVQQSLLIPPKLILDQFNEIYASIYRKIINASISIAKLQEARDRLLPKLMNGEIEV